jgi:hypothetical protein
MSRFTHLGLFMRRLCVCGAVSAAKHNCGVPLWQSHQFKMGTCRGEPSINAPPREGRAIAENNVQRARVLRPALGIFLHPSSLSISSRAACCMSALRQRGYQMKQIHNYRKPRVQILLVGHSSISICVTKFSPAKSGCGAKNCGSMFCRQAIGFRSIVTDGYPDKRAPGCRPSGVTTHRSKKIEYEIE